MATGKGVKLDTAYIELVVDASGVDKGIQDSLSKSDKHAKDAGKKIGKGVSDGVKEGTKDIGDRVKESLNKAGTGAKDVGRKVGKEVAEGVKEGTKDIGDHVRDSINKSNAGGGAREAGKKAGKEVAEGVKEGTQDVGDAVGKSFGKRLKDALAGTGIGQALRDEITGALKNDPGGAIGGLANSLRGMGQNDAASALDQIGAAAGKYQSTYAEMKTNLDGIKEGLSLVTAVAPGATAAIAGLGSAAAAALIPLASFFAWKELADNLSHHAPINPFTSRSDINQYDSSGAAGVNPNNRFSSGGGNLLPSMIAGLGGNKAGVTALGGATPRASGPMGGVDPFAPLDTGGAVPTPSAAGGGSGLPSMLQNLQNLGGRRGGNAPSGFAGGGGIVPAGQYTGPDASGKFPGWVNDLSKRFGLAPSTYSGHQTTNRAEAGFAPNPQNFNRGIDWGGPGTSPDQMQRFADFAQAHPELFEQVIWNNPNTGRTVTIAGGRLVPASYYADDLGGHRDHVHTRFAQGFSLDQMPSFDTGGPVPDDMAAWLHGGEHVLNPEQVKALGGQQGVEALLGGGGDQPDPNQPDGGSGRTEGYMPAQAAAGAQGIAGTSSLAGLIDLGNQAAAGAIDTGASAAQMAVGAMSMGAGGAAGGLGIQMGAALGKRAASYGFQALSIGADALIEQMFPFGAPRWLGYDYTQFAPNLNISKIGVTTGEKAVESALQAQGVDGPPQGLDAAGMASQQPGGPVSAGQLIGSQPSTGPTPEFKDKPPAASRSTEPRYRA
jgi:hypothetical protein